MPDFDAKMHQNRFRLGLRPRPRWTSLQRSPRPPSWFRGCLRLRQGRGEGREREGKRRREGKRGEGRGRAPPFVIPGYVLAGNYSTGYGFRVAQSCTTWTTPVVYWASPTFLSLVWKSLQRTDTVGKCLCQRFEHTQLDLRSSSWSSAYGALQICLWYDNMIRTTLSQVQSTQANNSWSQMSAVQPSLFLCVRPAQPSSQSLLTSHSTLLAAQTSMSTEYCKQASKAYIAHLAGQTMTLLTPNTSWR